MDRAIREYQQWTVANASLDFKNNPGFGYHGGVELTLYVTPQVGVVLECNYLIGQSDFPMTGSFTGGTASLQTITLTDEFSKAKIDFTGLELSLGLIFESGGGAPRKKRRR